MALADEPALEAARRRALRRYHLLATLLLVAMGSGFVALELTQPGGFWPRLAQAGCEAALIGGLADWFAVTALFRRPLGLPIPHTAVIPRNKERIGQGLAGFVERHFLEPELIAARLRSIDPAAAAGRWLARRDNAEAVSARLGASLPVLLASLDDREIRTVLLRALQGQVRPARLAPLLGTLLNLLRESDRHQALFDYALTVSRDYLRDHRRQVYEMVESRSAWWVPSRVDRRVAEALLEGMIELLGDLQRRDHHLRDSFDQATAKLIADLRESPETARRLSEACDQLLGSDRVQGYMEQLWGDLRAALESDLAASDSRIHATLTQALQSLGQALAGDEALRTRANARIEEVLKSVVTPWRAEVGHFIADVVRGWEARTIAERIELAVGRDLQYIRINGTVVGAIIGCLIFLATQIAA